MQCPDCNRIEFTEIVEVESIQLGNDPRKYQADVPVIHCDHCDFACTDHRAELIRQALQLAFDPAFNKNTYSIEVMK